MRLHTPQSPSDDNADNMGDRLDSTTKYQALSDDLSSASPRFNSSFDRQDDEVKLFLQQEWARTLSNTANTSLCDQWFDRIWDHHTEETRFYHTVMHLWELLKYLLILTEHHGMQSETNVDNLQVIRLAIFFHDIIYNPQSTSNEVDSARLFEEFAQQTNLPADLVATVVEYILATQTHHSSKKDASLQTFLDLDMAVLGKDLAAYKSYAHLIRQEFIHIPEAVYCEKRADFLEVVLQQEHIFATDWGLQAWEEAARANLAWEIGLLRQGRVPTVSTKD
jgi:predicted metal-dependent HD superfamily phosphohydrolase